MSKKAKRLLKDWRRTNYASECTPEIAGSDVTIMGWVHEIRDFGGIMFVIIRDVTGRVQITAPSKKVDEKIMEDFGSLGYRVSYRLYNAVDYGVPQTRERVFFVGTHDGLPDFAPPSPSCSRYVTAQEALGDLEALEEDRDFAHVWSLANVSGEQGNRRLVADRPGYTIRAECHGNIQFHYSLPRRISMREAARLQSFPDAFRFPCGLRETERQIGNAVPPVLAWNIAHAVKSVCLSPNAK